MLEKSRATRSSSREQEGLSLQHPNVCLLYLPTGPHCVKKGKILNSAKFNHDNVSCTSSSSSGDAEAQPTQLIPPSFVTRKDRDTRSLHTGLHPSQQLDCGINPEQSRWLPAASQIKRRAAKCSISRGKPALATGPGGGDSCPPWGNG